MKFLLFLVVLIPSLVCADSSFSLKPPEGDLSVSLLGSIFGVVQGVLHGTGSQIFGTMFGVYNSIILAMGMVILMYTFVVGTLNTAHEGEVMGKKWSSIWLPARTLGGVALLLPNSVGYSFIQIMVMWVVVQGVGAADLLWGKTLDYLDKGNVVVQPPMGTSGISSIGTVDNNAWLIPIAGSIFKAEVCMFALQNVLNNQTTTTTTSTGGTTSYFANTMKAESAGNNKWIINFPGDVDLGDGQNYKGACGSVTWNESSYDEKVKNSDGTNSTQTVYTTDRNLAMQQIVVDVQSQAQLVANFIAPLKTSSTSGSLSNLLVPNTLYYSMIDYQAIMAAFWNEQKSKQTTNVNDFITESKKVGWVMAGAYFYNIAQLTQKASVKEQPENITASFPDLSQSNINLIKNSAWRSKLTAGASTDTTCKAESFDDDIETYICVGEYANIGKSKSQTNPYIPAAAANPPSDLFKSRNKKDKANLVLNIFTLGIAGCIQNANNVYSTMGDIYNAATVGGNPIVKVSELGIGLVNTVENVYLSALGIIIAAVVIGGIVVLGTGSGIATSFIAVLLWLMPLLSAILLPLLIAGATMAYYVPLIPFVLFLFGALTWLASVVEAMIAAPLVALGLAHPEGHELLGKAEYAVMLLANVFLRPLLMIFGFIAATILSSVMLWLLNYGFTQAWQGNAKPDMLRVIYFAATIIVYMTLVLTIINRTFALIYEVPNKVLRWVGGQVESTGEGAALDEFKQGAGKGLETTAQVASKAGDMAVEGAGKAGQAGIEKMQGAQGGADGASGSASDGGEAGGGGAGGAPPVA